MNFIVTKKWKAIEYNKLTISIPSSPRLEIAAGNNTPDSGIKYSGQIKSFYTDTKLWIKIAEESNITQIEVNIQNFI